MRFFIILSLIFTSAFGFSQNVTDYKYVQVPEKFTDFKENQYQLNYYLKLLLRKNNFTVLNENVNTWPEEARKEPCLALRADVLKLQKLLKNGLELKFYDCKNNEIASFEGVSRIKEFEPGYQEAMGFAVKAAGKFEGVGKSEDVKNTENETAVSIPTQEIQNPGKSDIGLLFENEGRKVSLSELKNGSLLLFQEPEHVLMAQLNPSSRKGVFQVTVIGQKEKYTTTGFYDGDTLTIDFIENGKPQTLEFKKSTQ